MTGLLVRNCEKNPERDTKIPFYKRSLKFFSTRKMNPLQKNTSTGTHNFYTVKDDYFEYFLFVNVS